MRMRDCLIRYLSLSVYTVRYKGEASRGYKTNGSEIEEEEEEEEKGVAKEKKRSS